jgi:hypothetical protein
VPSKIFLLTATPIYDNYGQFIELILNLCPKINDKDIVRNFTAIKKLVPHLRGKISYYKLDDKSFFPSVKTENLLIPLTITQENAIKLIQPDKEVKDDEENEEIKDSFCLKERQLSISTIKKSIICCSDFDISDVADAELLPPLFIKLATSSFISS